MMIINDNTHTNSPNTQTRIVVAAIMTAFSNLAVDTYISISIYIHNIFTIFNKYNHLLYSL